MVCLCTCLCMSIVHVGTGAYSNVCYMWGPGICGSWLPILLSTFFSEARSLHWTWSSLTGQADRPVSPGVGHLAVVCKLGSQVAPSWAFSVGAGKGAHSAFLISSLLTQPPLTSALHGVREVTRWRRKAWIPTAAARSCISSIPVLVVSDFRIFAHPQWGILG